MDHELVPCPFCGCADVLVAKQRTAISISDTAVAAMCRACGARGPLRSLTFESSFDAAGALAVDDWNAVAEPFHEAREDERAESVNVGLTDADKAEIDRIAASIENEQEPATDEPDARGDAAQGSTTAADDAESTSADPPQVPEAAGGGGSEGAPKDTPKAPTVDPEAAARVGAQAQGVEQPRPDPASNGADRGGAAADKTITERVREFLHETGWNAKDFAHHTGTRVADVTRLINGNAGRNHPVRAAAKAFLDSRPTAAVKRSRTARIEKLPTTWSPDPGLNELPKLQAPPRCSRTP